MIRTLGVASVQHADPFDSLRINHFVTPVTHGWVFSDLLGSAQSVQRVLVQ
jgi:hypothetical protein